MNIGGACPDNKIPQELIQKKEENTDGKYVKMIFFKLALSRFSTAKLADSVNEYMPNIQVP